MTDSPLCKRLKEARLSANISQKKLGIEAGMDQFSASARMNHYEMGRHTPDYSILSRIAAVLRLPVSYFYADSEKLANLISGFHTLKNEDQDLILRLINNPAILEKCYTAVNNTD